MANKFFGELYFQEEGFYFPEKDWKDFIIVVLNWWCAALRKILYNETYTKEFLFMDGPFSIKIKHIEEDIFHLTFIKQNEVVRLSILS